MRYIKGYFRLDLWQIRVSTTSEAVDAVSAVFSSLGVDALEIEDIEDVLARKRASHYGEWIDERLLDIPPQGARASAYLAADRFSEKDVVAWIYKLDEALESVRRSGLDAGDIAIDYHFVPSVTYEDAWKNYYHAVSITDRLAIVPSWEADAWTPDHPGQMPIFMDPGMAFGTGTHETTILCLRALQKVMQYGDRVLDVGTGTGVLAIAAAKLGSGSVLALDLDDVAVKAARQNVLANDVAQGVFVIHSDLVAQVPPGDRYDVITANLLADIVVRLLPDVITRLEPGGCLIASGLIVSQIERVTAAFYDTGFADVTIDTMADWVVITAQLAK